MARIARTAMRTLFAIMLTCLYAFQAHAQLDTNLTRQIHSWRKGNAVPARLLKFPDGKIDIIPGCGLRVIGSEVSDYISEIQDTDVLAAMMFHPRAEPVTFHAAA